MSSDFSAVFARRKQVPGLADDEVWRDYMERHTGLRSLKQLSPGHLGLLLDALAKDGAAKGGQRRASTPKGDQVALIRQYWSDLAAAGHIEDADEARLLAWAVRQLKRPVDRLEWLSGADKSRLIQALKGWLGRLKAKAGK
ncbi:regulatory protein GemA [Niveispirillum cyanobacteriorum]|uniref:Uncharacterized protein n=1 Tax=Niveispirillum cyanobacteriorum TaxID=1612173 RepID=A0A2K9NDN3_9PROT|nr:regulatory protein GemA [Niveispirillum cyanobacteriorum]AUN31260.1 hypothetical protein C0V82_14210 [Niveispirillum cyanobacteriorum]GGE72829.1 hypothetical protein GCM10011317_32610 [Niveispirillum cyanobacteriorum]